MGPEIFRAADLAAQIDYESDALFYNQVFPKARQPGFFGATTRN